MTSPPPTRSEHDQCPIPACPACDGDDFRITRSARGVGFRCAGCGSHWRFELGYLSLVRDVA